MSHHTLVQQAVNAARAGNPAIAKMHLQKAAEAAPDDPSVWLWMGWLSDSPLNMIQCLEMVLQSEQYQDAAKAGLAFANALAAFQAGTGQNLPDAAIAAPVRETFDQTVPAESVPPPLPNTYPDTWQPNADCDSTEDVSSNEIGSEPQATIHTNTSDDAWSVASPPIEQNESTTPPSPPVFRAAVTDWFTVEPVAVTQDRTEQTPTKPASNSNYQPVHPAVQQGLNNLFSVVPESPEISAPYCPPDADPIDDCVEETGTSPVKYVPPVAAPPIQPAWADDAEVPASNELVMSPPPVPQVHPDELLVATHDREFVNAISNEPALPHATTPQAVPQTRTILVVDDSPTVRKLVALTLEKRGFRVVSAFDGVAAIKEIAAHNPALILMDINMPRMDGYQLCKLVRKHESTRHIPVVMLSGKDGMFDRLRGKLVGCSGYVSKPFAPEELAETIEGYLKQQTSV